MTAISVVSRFYFLSLDDQFYDTVVIFNIIELSKPIMTLFEDGKKQQNSTKCPIEIQKNKHFIVTENHCHKLWKIWKFCKVQLNIANIFCPEDSVVMTLLFIEPDRLYIDNIFHFAIRYIFFSPESIRVSTFSALYKPNR